VITLVGCNQEEKKTDESVALTDVCQSEKLCEEYINIWFTEFTNRNSMSESEFLQHISIDEAYLEQNTGELFHIKYTVILDWARIENNDQFAVFIDSSDERFPTLSIPRNQYLSAAEITIVLNNDAFYSSITPVIFAEEIIFENSDEALQTLQNDAGVENMQLSRLSFYVPGNIPRENGYPYLFGIDNTNESINECISGEINLVTGETHFVTDVCYIIN